MYGRRAAATPRRRRGGDDADDPLTTWRCRGDDAATTRIGRKREGSDGNADADAGEAVSDADGALDEGLAALRALQDLLAAHAAASQSETHGVRVTAAASYLGTNKSGANIFAYRGGVVISVSARRSLFLAALDGGRRPRPNAEEASTNARDLSLFLAALDGGRRPRPNAGEASKPRTHAISNAVAGTACAS